MPTNRRSLSVLFLLALILCAPGCFGGSQNPSYFPHWVPFGDVIRTHAKPIGPSYYANFDPHAVDLAVEPQVSTSQVGAQVIVLATVRDEKGVPRRNRRVDWLVTGGNIVEVDEGGFLPGRGGIEGSRAFSYTNHGENRLSRGNANKADDVMVRPGQSWCVVSSPVEGDTHVQVVVPAINNWEKRTKTVTIRWVDATWEFPPRAVAKFGTEHEFVTRVARFTDRQALSRYSVRYKIIDGPPAMLLPSRTQEEVVTSDLSGLAKVKIAQLGPASGTNRVSVEIIRPPDPTTPSGAGVSIVTGETSVEWIAPDVRLVHSGPATAAVGQDILYTTAARNEGRIDSQWVEFRLPIPDGMEFVSANPPTQPEGGQLVYTLPALPVSQVHTVQSTFRARRAGTFKSVALMRTAEGQNDQKEVITNITTPQLKAEILGPKTSVVDAPISFRIRLSNPGSGPIEEIHLVADFDKGFEHDKAGATFLETKARGLAAGESRNETLILTPRRMGPLGLRVSATGGGQKAQDQFVVLVQQPKLSLKVDGPARRYVGRPAEWKIFVKNESDAEQSGVVIRDRLPAELRFAIAGQNGRHAAGEVTWELGTLRPGQEVVLDLTTECVRANPAAEKTTLLSADGNIKKDSVTRIAIDGIAALKMEMKHLSNPVEVGKNVVYRLDLTNTGSAPAKNIEVKATLPELLKAMRATGPAKEAIAGQFITFGKVDAVPAGGTITFQFECQALKEGDARFRVEYTSDLNPAAIFEEEATRIVPALLAPPPPPGGGVPVPLPPG